MKQQAPAAVSPPSATTDPATQPASLPGASPHGPTHLPVPLAQRPTVVLALLILVFPAGLALTWANPRWPATTKAILTTLTALLLLATLSASKNRGATESPRVPPILPHPPLNAGQAALLKRFGDLRIKRLWDDEQALHLECIAQANARYPIPPHTFAAPATVAEARARLNVQLDAAANAQFRAAHHLTAAEQASLNRIVENEQIQLIRYRNDP